MARKRFTDADKWHDPWFHKLSFTAKALFSYLCDRCDAAGVWEIDWERAQFDLGVEHDDPYLELRRAVNEMGPLRVRLIDNAQRLHIVKFVEFQYPRGLNPKAPAQVQVINLLRRYGMPIPFVNGMGVASDLGRQSQQDTDTDKDTDKDTERPTVPTPTATPLPLSQTKPGPLELRQIVGLRITQDNLPSWLALAADVGLDLLRAAEREMTAKGLACWPPETQVVAMRIRRERMAAKAARSAQEASSPADEARTTAVEQARLQALAEARELVAAHQAEQLVPEARAHFTRLVDGIAAADAGKPVNLSMALTLFKNVGR